MKMLKMLMVLLWAGLTLVLAGNGKYEDVKVPPPMELKMDLPVAWDVVRDVLTKMGYEIVTEEKAAGRIVTKEEESTAGAYALDELKKVAVVVTDLQTTFTKGKYSLEIAIQFLKPKLTQVGVSARIQGQKRTFDGKESWIGLESNGVLEKRFLNELGIATTGKRIYDKEMPYWKKNSQQIDLKK